jgi:predicted SprT family Zn-dependent metalloprotease
MNLPDLSSKTAALSSQAAVNPLSFTERLRTAGIAPGDSEELRLNKSLLMLATTSLFS